CMEAWTEALSSAQIELMPIRTRRWATVLIVTAAPNWRRSRRYAVLWSALRKTLTDLRLSADRLRIAGNSPRMHAATQFADTYTFGDIKSKSMSGSMHFRGLREAADRCANTRLNVFPVKNFERSSWNGCALPPALNESNSEVIVLFRTTLGRVTGCTKIHQTTIPESAAAESEAVRVFGACHGLFCNNERRMGQNSIEQLC